jgi:hypothetical protein
MPVSEFRRSYAEDEPPGILMRLLVVALFLLSFCVMSIVIWAMARFGGMLLDLVDRL